MTIGRRTPLPPPGLCAVCFTYFQQRLRVIESPRGPKSHPQHQKCPSQASRLRILLSVSVTVCPALDACVAVGALWKGKALTSVCGLPEHPVARVPTLGLDLQRSVGQGFHIYDRQTLSTARASQYCPRILWKIFRYCRIISFVPTHLFLKTGHVFLLFFLFLIRQ